MTKIEGNIDQEECRACPNWYRCTIAFVAFLHLNSVPTLFSRGDYRLDGYETVGFPFTFFQRGGYSPREEFYPDVLANDLIFAFFFATIIASAIPAKFWPKRFKIASIFLWMTIIATALLVYNNPI